MAPTITRWPTWYSGSSPSPSASMTPTGSWPSTSPVRAGYSPFTMWTSVPQMVVVVMRTTAWPARGDGFGRSTMPRRPVPRKATAFMVSMVASRFDAADGADVRRCHAQRAVRHQEDRAAGLAEDAVGDTAQHEAPDQAVAVRPEHDRVRPLIVGVAHDLADRLTGRDGD